MYVVVGLGNPGSKYDGTRHNVGFDVIDILANRHNVKINKIKFKSVYGEVNLGNEKVMFVKPQTFMNRSGESVLEISNFFKVPVENIIVIVDDIDIGLGALRIRSKGSAGSHNGMKSIIYLLQKDNFPRVKIGVGKPEVGRDLADFVLGRFNKEEQIIMDEALNKAADSIECLIKEGIDSSMNKYNG
ncbi:peptidyl-tRNA hydrolase Pth [Gottschalkia acidurici 9a]|uniref:Peptidyl-tRNA hydrolase n=1 Tax=Gottschalkia acidurici (strain ATCC 7906 / DSM 604 / BCRC 14475 / CIP 104303 / KCTC 5404 / NCIMB 10678 / 9a) TaxID=1128398 RepID=K0B1N3_GOTA9|nr:aminoacyl-tRNA hydrolase [Gottschalkia acidurici]AFS79379.1 peptidyl-tRNA hydrolase Pth [Gottschalkia acidurici 9a]